MTKQTERGTHERDAMIATRKAHMLVGLQGVMRRCRMRRQAGRIGAGIAVALLLVASPVMGVWWLARATSSEQAEVDHAMIADAGSGTPGAQAVGALQLPEESVRVDTAVSERSVPAFTATHFKLRVVSSEEPRRVVREVRGGAGGIVRLVNDDELLDALANSGRDCGIVRQGMRMDVVCNSCADAFEWIDPIKEETDESEAEKPSHG